MYKIIVSGLIIVLSSFSSLLGQINDPIWDALGVPDQVLRQIDNAIEAKMGYSYAISPMNMDSVIGNPNQGDRQDPYGTLKNCYVFAANAVEKAEIGPHGIVGVFRDGQLIWYSDPINTVEYSVTGFIIETRDLNKNGNVEIITSWNLGSGIEPSFLWIFSWDGSNGNLITEKDTQGRSVIKSTSGGDFTLVDIEGDGIFEVQGDILKNKSKTIYETVTYSWNGQKYGKWPDTPQIEEDYFFPRDKIDIIVTANIKKDKDDLYQYRYIIESLKSSIQNVNQILLEEPLNKIESVEKPKNWSFIAYEKVLNWKANSFGEINYITPGTQNSNISYSAHGIPTIVKYYILGDNPRPSGISGKEWFENVKINSASGFTIGAGSLPSPFGIVSFADTLLFYTTRACELGWITNKGICRSLEVKLENVKKQFEGGRIKPAANALEAFINEVEAQKGKHLTNEGYGLLYFNAMFLLEKLNRK